MRALRHALAFIAAAPLLLVAAFGQQAEHNGAAMGDMPGMEHGAAASSPAVKDMMDAMMKMDEGMKVAPTGDADRDFVAMMIPHHQGAIDMARVELKYGKDPALRKLANAIVSAQEKEIKEMRSWQANHGRR